MIAKYFTHFDKIINNTDFITCSEIHKRKVNDFLGIIEGKINIEKIVLYILEVIKIIMNKILRDNIYELGRYCDKYNVKQLYAFGSVCTEKFNDESDIDFLVNFQKNISIEKYTDNYFILHELFEKRLEREIDLLTVNMLANPYFINVMEKTKILIYERRN